MFTYQVRPRGFKLESGKPLNFPATGDVRFHFEPKQPFGMQAGGGLTAVKAVAAKVLFDANTGRHSIESEEPLKPLDVTVSESNPTMHLVGNVLTVSSHFQDLKELTQLVESIFFAFPTLLNVSFADSPYIARVDGSVGGSPFRWELSEWRASFLITTQEKQEQFVEESWQRLEMLTVQNRVRLIGALHYFHVACRLARQGSTAGEFVAEVILNLSKSLEVAFPPMAGVGTRDAVRAALKQLGFSDEEIERDFVPAMALRNEIDVGHVLLGLFTPDQLRVIHAYTERAESAFRRLFTRLIEEVHAGRFEVASYQTGPAGSEAIALVQRLAQATPADP